MSKSMNLIKLVMHKKSCKFCIVIKQKFESHKNFVIFDKHFLNLMWSDFIESFVLNDKIKYFVTFFCDFIKRSMICVLRVKLNTFEAFRHFQLHNEHENNQMRHLSTNWEKKYSSNEFNDYRFEHDIKWKSIISKIFEQNKIVERWRDQWLRHLLIIYLESMKEMIQFVEDSIKRHYDKKVLSTCIKIYWFNLKEEEKEKKKDFTRTSINFERLMTRAFSSSLVSWFSIIAIRFALVIILLWQSFRSQWLSISMISCLSINNFFLQNS
jgi:hypothetical protein